MNHDPNTHLERDVVQQQGSVGQQRVLGVKLRVELGRVLQPDKLGLALHPLVNLDKWTVVMAIMMLIT